MAYFNVDEVESGMMGLANTFPTLCSLIALPHQTAEGRACHAMRIGAPNTPKQKGILFIACVHAREWGGAEISISFAADLLEGYTMNAGLKYGGKSFTAAEIKSIVEEVDLFVFPCVNPDGRNFSQFDQKGALWRKNRNPANSGGNPANIGVDINRNYDFLWDFKTAFDPGVVMSSTSLASDDPSQDLYHGPAPESEAETRNVVWLLDNYPQIGWFMDIHSFTGDVLHSWGDAPNQSQDQTMTFLNPAFDKKRGVEDADIYGEFITDNDDATATRLAEKTRDAIIAVRGEPYLAHQSFFLDVGQMGQNMTFPTSGASDDYSWSRHLADPSKPKVYAYTLEFGLDTHPGNADDFHPPWAEMQDIILDICSGLVEFCLEARVVFAPPHIYEEEEVQILFGVTSDGGGAIRFGNGKIIRIPPWEPWIRDVLNGLLAYKLAGRIADGGGAGIEREALGAIIAAAEKQLNGGGG